MTSLLAATSIPISLVPERLIGESARDQGIELNQVKSGLVVSERDSEQLEIARRVIGGAIERWRQVAPSWMRLNFMMQHQEQTEWCWAATSASVLDFYNPQARARQCGIVNAEKGLDVCCRDGSNEVCDQPNVLDNPLSRVGLLDHKQTGPAAYDVIRHEIDAGRPLAWHIHWSGGGGHFAVIEGYQRDGAQWVSVEDPWYGSSDVAVSTLTQAAYQGNGLWTHTYFTRPPPSRLHGSRDLRPRSEIQARPGAEEAEGGIDGVLAAG